MEIGKVSKARKSCKTMSIHGKAKVPCKTMPRHGIGEFIRQGYHVRP
ncbi:hypothetical protein F383_25326 [Gossypium arboreum]|uniref:Uncharacterized protein n=1 Tax=Gossypium arboreum TaxID=29729 RepID=A0A0B0PAV2_GOSAR|nr:hypothetical protein F383_25326 [Gossypium arboreum]